MLLPTIVEAEAQGGEKLAIILNVSAINSGSHANVEMRSDKPAHVAVDEARPVLACEGRKNILLPSLHIKLERFTNISRQHKGPIGPAPEGAVESGISQVGPDPGMKNIAGCKSGQVIPGRPRIPGPAAAAHSGIDPKFKGQLKTESSAHSLK